MWEGTCFVVQDDRSNVGGVRGVRGKVGGVVLVGLCRVQWGLGFF